MINKLVLTPSELLVLKKILIRNGMSKKFIDQMPNDEILEAAIFFVSNEEIIKDLRKGMSKCKEEVCSCQMDKRKKRK